MRRETWRLIRASKRFYVGTFRFSGSMLVFSLCVNLVLGWAIFYAYAHMPERHYYATNGVVPPTELIAMSAANETSVPLLAADQNVNDDEKLIPK
jgi:intracellular multiplication protein IcmM